MSWLDRLSTPKARVPVASPDAAAGYGATRGFDVGATDDGDLVAFPAGMSRDDAKQLLSNYDWWMASFQWLTGNIEKDRRTRNAAYDAMDRLPLPRLTLDTYADEAMSVGLIDEPIMIEVPGDPGLQARLMAWAKARGLMSRGTGNIRSLMKHGDLGMALKLPAADAPPDELTLTPMASPRWSCFRPVGSDVPLGYFLNRPKAGAPGIAARPTKTDLFQPWEFVHLTVPDEDAAPYGRSALEGMRVPVEQETTIEALLAISRASRVERLVVKVPVGSANPAAAAAKLNAVKAAWKNVVFRSDAGGGRTQARPQALTDVLYMPGDQGYDVTKLNSQIDLSSIEDVEYFRDQVLTASRLPKSFLLADQGNSLGNQGLQSQDLKFARALVPYQDAYVAGLTKLLTLVAVLMGADPARVEVRVTMRRPANLSDQLILSYRAAIEAAVFALEGKMTVLGEEAYRAQDPLLAFRGVLAEFGLPKSLIDALAPGGAGARRETLDLVENSLAARGTAARATTTTAVDRAMLARVTPGLPLLEIAHLPRSA